LRGTDSTERRRGLICATSAATMADATQANLRTFLLPRPVFDSTSPVSVAAPSFTRSIARSQFRTRLPPRPFVALPEPAERIEEGALPLPERRTKTNTLSSCERVANEPRRSSRPSNYLNRAFLLKGRSHLSRSVSFPYGSLANAVTAVGGVTVPPTAPGRFRGFGTAFKPE
jgi:hypothetical protein